MHAAGLGDRQEQQVQVLQRYWELGEKAGGAPTGLGRDASGTVGRLVILMQHKVLESLREASQLQPWSDAGGAPRWGITWQPREQPLIDGVEEAFDVAAPPGLADEGKDRLDFQVRTDLFEMLRRKIGSVISIQDPRNAAHLPGRLGFPPDGLPQGQRRVEGTGGLEGHHVPCHRTAIIVQDDSEPRFPGVALLVGEEEVQQRVVRLPNGIGRLRLAAVEEIKGLAVDLTARMGQGYQRGGELPHDIMDVVVARDVQALRRGDVDDLAMDRGDGGRGRLEGQGFHELDQE